MEEISFNSGRISADDNDDDEPQSHLVLNDDVDDDSAQKHLILSYLEDT